MLFSKANVYGILGDILSTISMEFYYDDATNQYIVQLSTDIPCPACDGERVWYVTTIVDGVEVKGPNVETQACPGCKGKGEVRLNINTTLDRKRLNGILRRYYNEPQYYKGIPF